MVMKMKDDGALRGSSVRWLCFVCLFLLWAVPHYIFALRGTASTMICKAILRHSSAELICEHG